MAEEQRFVEKVPVDWSHIPEFSDLVKFRKTIIKQEKARTGIRILTPTLVSFLTIGQGDYFEHTSTDIQAVKKMYQESGFDTDFIWQDPIGHKDPTVACPIGFPINLPKQYQEMRRYNKWICRVHVEIVSRNGKLLSIPHVEIDPKFDPVAHLKDTYLGGNIVRGPIAVEILRLFGVV